MGRTTVGVGATGTFGFIPADLEPIYRTRTPTGLAVYLRIRPKVMQMGQEMMSHPMVPADSMPGMHMPAGSADPGQAGSRREQQGPMTWLPMLGSEAQSATRMAA